MAILVFVRMAMRNVGRNWNRTGMIIVGMLVASGMMTLSLSFASGYAEGASLSYRRMTAADILIYPNHYVFSGPGDPSLGWEWRTLSADEPVDALFFHPGLTQGYLAPATDGKATSFPIGYVEASAGPATDLGASAGPAADLAASAGPTTDLPADLASAVGAVDGIRQVAPSRLARAFIVLEGQDGTQTRLEVTLRGRDIQTDLDVFDMISVSSHHRYFRPEQDGDWVAFLNDAVPASLPSNGSRLVLEVPSIVGADERGTPVYDYSHPQTFYFLVYGRYRLEVGQATLEGIPQGRKDLPKTWPVAIDEPEVWVPAATFDTIYEAVAGVPQARTGQYGVILDSMSRAKDVAAELARRLPSYSVVTVPQEVSLSGIRFRAKVTSEDPFTVSVTRDYGGRSSLTLDVRAQVAALSFLVAGLLVAANMFILVTQRRREIGVLKALGAGRRDILILFLTEALGYALAGSLLGFLAIRLLTLATIMGSAASLYVGALVTVKAAGVVIGSTVGVSLVFGFLPAWEASRTPSATLFGEA